jgi:uncharacterized RDD family membrane protein YckC
VLGARSGAAMIDLVLLFGLFIILSVTIGEASVGGGGFSFYLDNAIDSALLLGLVLVYYFALEATIGQTVGKLLVGVRVVRADGDRPSVGAVAIRTVLRVVDWLPLLYLVGFLTALVTGARQQRLGDLAARTGIARAVPLRHRGRAVAAFVSTLVLVVGGSVVYAASDGGTKTYRSHGVSFDYPAGWTEANAQSEEANALWGRSFAAGEYDAALVGAYQLDASVTAQNLDLVMPDLEEAVRQFAEQSGGTVRAGPGYSSVAGKPAVRYEATGTVDGTPYEITLQYIFDGTTQYYVNCQHTDERADEIERGCEQIVQTFTLDSKS